MKKKKIFFKWKKKYIFFFKKDPKYNSFLLSKFINNFMYNGKKIKSIKKIYFILKKLKWEFKKNPYLIFLKYINKMKPNFLLKKAKIAGKLHQIPFPIKKYTALKISIKWLYSSIFLSKDFKFFLKKAYFEFFNFFLLKKKSNFLKKIEEHYNLINEHKSNEHFRWK